MTEIAHPLTLFRFHVEFVPASLGGAAQQEGEELGICHGAFSECTGLEATMEPKAIEAGGWNYGARQRAGKVTFGTVILKRGITTTRHLWKWFSMVNEQGKAAIRVNVTISMARPGQALPNESKGDSAGSEAGGATGGNENAAGGSDKLMAVKLYRALPVKFKGPDLNAQASEVSVEELHLVHEGISFE